MLGVIFLFYVKNLEDNCGEFYFFGLGYIEVIIFVIEWINNNFNLFLNVILGFDIRDYCDIFILVMKMVNDFVKSNYFNDFFER